MKRDNLESRILGFLGLKEGWGFGKSLRIKEDNALLAIAITRKLSDEVIIQIAEAFPTEDGLVNLRLSNGSNTFGCYVDASGDEVECYEESDSEINFLGVKKISEIVGWLEECAKELLGCYQEWYIAEENLKQVLYWHLESLETIDLKIEFHSSANSVQSAVGGQYINSSIVVENTADLNMQKCMSAGWY